MNSVHDLVVDPARVPAPLASWYTQGITDGLGDRLLMFDNTAAASLELLRFRPELAAAPGFECAVRERVEQLARFKHPAFSEVRSVERLDGDEGLTLVSAHTPGKRLSEMLQATQPQGALPPAFAAWLIRRLAPALADLHEQGAGVAHGSLSPERIVLTPDGRLVIVEHVLGAALDGLQLPADRLWRDLGIIRPAGLTTVRRLDRRTDVIQLGLVALSVLLGRRVTPREYPQKLGLLLDEFAESAGRRSPSLVPPLRLWLERALEVQGGGFESAMEAADGLGELPERGTQCFPEMHMGDMESSANGSAPLAETSGNDAGNSVGTLVPNRWTPNRLASDPWAFTELVEPTPATIAAPPVAPSHRRRLLTGRNLAVGFAIVALIEAAAIAGLIKSYPANQASTAKVPVTIEAPTSGDIVTVDGRQVGTTPLELSAGSTHLIRVVRREETPPEVVPIPAAPGQGTATGANVDEQTARTLALAAARQRSGGLKLSSPIELHVLEGERVLGSSADGPIVATAGVHQLDFVNNALGYRSRQTVEIKAGQIVPLTVRPPDGRVSINALPWAQVWIDGNPVGETPLANLSVPVGEHEIIFRHPQLGERRETTIVRSDVLTRVSATLGR